MTSGSTLLGGRYEIGEVIGYGGMAEVHKGRDVRLGRDVAIKMLRSDLSQDPTSEARFRREAQSAASLSSPSIVAVYDTGEQLVAGVKTPYIVMEYVEGQTLRTLLSTEGRLLPPRALEIAAAVCTALEQAHANGIVHRDVKPSNIMLTPTGDVKVMDFGIARALTTSNTTMTQTSAVVGTAHYLSPEQARGEHVDARSDVYSTGCLLYELLTGAPPFTGDTAVAVAYQHVREDPVAPSAVEPDIPEAVDAIVLYAMAKNPINRYQSAADMRADIERALAGEPVQARPVPREDFMTSSVPPTTVLMREPGERRRRGLAYLLLTVATIGVFVVALVAARSVIGKSQSDVSTPDLRHQTIADARATLLSQGLKVGTVTYKYTGKANKGIVLAQDPPAQILLNRGHAVDLTVSNGIMYVTIPQGLQGENLAGAKAALAAGHLLVGQIVPRNSSAPANWVLGTQPAAGTSVPAGTKVTLIVSNAHVKVPNVVGKDPVTAAAILQQVGFNPVVRDAAVYTNKNDGLIVSQYPAGNTYAETGSTITIYVDNKQPKPHPTKSATSSPNPSPSTNSSPSTTPTP